MTEFSKEILNENFLNKIEDKGLFFRFLADWYDQVIFYNRSEFINGFKNIAIVPTTFGWKNPQKSTIFQANLREKKNLEIPEGFGFDIVMLSVYGENPSYNGIVAIFVDKLGVKEYSARSVIQSSILPILIDTEEFIKLQEENPKAIFDAYRFIAQYFDQDLSTSKMDARLGKIPVPAFTLAERNEIVWNSSNSVYFSETWTGNDDLEILFNKISDVIFLCPIIVGLRLENQEERIKWRSFFERIGVVSYPRVYEWNPESTYKSLFYSEVVKNRIFGIRYNRECQQLLTSG